MFYTLQAFLRFKNELFWDKISNKILANFWLFWEVEFWLNPANPGAFSGSLDFFHLAALNKPSLLSSNPQRRLWFLPKIRHSNRHPRIFIISGALSCRRSLWRRRSRRAWRRSTPSRPSQCCGGGCCGTCFKLCISMSKSKWYPKYTHHGSYGTQ